MWAWRCERERICVCLYVCYVDNHDRLLCICFGIVKVLGGFFFSLCSAIRSHSRHRKPHHIHHVFVLFVWCVVDDHIFVFAHSKHKIVVCAKFSRCSFLCVCVCVVFIVLFSRCDEKWPLGIRAPSSLSLSKFNIYRQVGWFHQNAFFTQQLLYRLMCRPLK